jgi:hypothetical protein
MLIRVFLDGFAESLYIARWWRSQSLSRMQADQFVSENA